VARPFLSFARPADYSATGFGAGKKENPRLSQTGFKGTGVFPVRVKQMN
jgi:hypothetical protein